LSHKFSKDYNLKAENHSDSFTFRETRALAFPGEFEIWEEKGGSYSKVV